MVVYRATCNNFAGAGVDSVLKTIWSFTIQVIVAHCPICSPTAGQFMISVKLVDEGGSDFIVTTINDDIRSNFPAVSFKESCILLRCMDEI